MSSTNIQQEEIKTILEVIAEQTEIILTYTEGQIPQIELDLVRENIRKLYTNYTQLDKLNSKLIERLTDAIVDNEHPVKIVKPESKIQKEEIAPKKSIAEIKPVKESERIIEEFSTEVIKQVDSEIVDPFIEPSPKPAFEEKKQEPIEISVEPEVPVNKPKPVVVAPNSETVKEEQKNVKSSKTVVNNHATSTGNLFASTSTSVADQFKDEKKSLYEKIGNTSTDISYAEKLQQKPITDLVKSIGLNEKFLFIKELFKNNSDDYNEAILLLNSFNSITQAFDYLDVLKQKFEWDETSDASLKLYDMIRRKYQK